MNTKLILSTFVALSILFVCLCAGCVSNNDSDSSSDLSNTLIYAGEGSSTINPLINDHAEMNDLVFSGLLKYDAYMQPISDLAESFSYDDASMTYTFNLKKGVKWHDGTPFTAKDVVFTLETLNNDETLSSEITDNYKDIKSVTAVDDYTVKIVMDKYNYAMLTYFTIGIVPKHLLEGKDINTDPFNQHPVGTGKYKFVEWDRAANMVVFERNTDYYGKIPNIERVIYKLVEDKTTKTTMLTAKEIDLAWLNAEYADTFRGVKGYQNFDFKTADYRALSMNFEYDFWKQNADSVGVLNYAIDKNKLAETVHRGYGFPAYSPIQLSEYGGNKAADIYDYNIEKFHSEMKKLGWNRGSDGVYERNGQKFHFTFFVPSEEEERVDLAKLCAQMLKEQGVEMELFIQSGWDYLSYEGFLSGEASQFTPDKDYALFVTGASGNYMGYSNKDVDALLTQARHEKDKNKRISIYHEFETAFAKQPANVLLTYLDGNFVATDRVKGLDTARLLGHHAAGVLWNIEEWTLLN